jgi:hypothetical protein
MDHKHILLSERSHSEQLTPAMIPSGKCSAEEKAVREEIPAASSSRAGREALRANRSREDSGGTRGAVHEGQWLCAFVNSHNCH